MDASRCGTQLENTHREMMHEKYEQLKSKVGNGINDLEALAQLSDYVAAFTPNSPGAYEKNMGDMLTGHSQRNSLENELKLQLHDKNPSYDPGVDFSDFYKEHKDKAELMQSGYDPVFQDNGDGGNQAHHYWFYVQVSFEYDFPTAVVADVLHETVVANPGSGKSYQDYALGVQGATLGTALKCGWISPMDTGSFMMSSLSPGSNSAYYWSNPPSSVH